MKSQSTQSIQSYLESLPYWQPAENVSTHEEFIESVDGFSQSFDTLYWRAMQYVSLITDAKPMMSMRFDDKNQRLINHLQALSFYFNVLSDNLENTTEAFVEYGFFEELPEEEFEINLEYYFGDESISVAYANNEVSNQTTLEAHEK